MKTWSFYQHWLDRVSRSFALCIPALEPPFRDQVALAYLLFRVVDTIEDAPFTERATQHRQFDRMRSFLRKMPSPQQVDAFAAAFPANLTVAESALLGETHVLLAEAHAMPPPIRAAMFHAMDRMAIGMDAYAQRPVPLHLVDLEDVARYCCFVAGVVGEMLTQLWAIDRSAPPPSASSAYHFGLFLQKVNILKDQHEDEAVGRFFVPDRAELIASVHKDSLGALGYLQALPHGDRYRIFCAWSLMLGAVTIAQLDEPKRSRRGEVAQLLAQISAIADDDAALAQQLTELMPPLPTIKARPSVTKPESFEWFRHALAAPLSEAELRELGIGVIRTTAQRVLAVRPTR
jgi:phytoene/squalene synthetase